MRQIPILLFMLMFLTFGSGCIDSQEVNPSENVTPAPILYYERGDISIPINIAEIPVRSFTANVTEVIETLLTDQRAGVLLENGWNITSARMGFDEGDPNRTYIDVEFRKDGLSFFIEVDEQERRATRGRCSAPVWLGGGHLQVLALRASTRRLKTHGPVVCL